MCMYLILMKITIKTFHQILGVKYFIVHFKYAGQNMAKAWKTDQHQSNISQPNPAAKIAIP